MYEQEKQLLLNSREAAICDRNDALRKHSELQDKYHELSSSYHSFQTSTAAKMSEYKNTLKIKEFELERLNLLYSEISNKYNESAKEVDKLTKKLEIVLDDYNTTRCDHVNEVNTLTLKVRTLQNELSSLRSGDESVKDLIGILGSENISCNKEHLARKLIELSKNNELLKESLQNKEEALERALRKTEQLESALHHSNQPASYLVDSIKKRDEQVSKYKTDLLKLSKEIKEIRYKNKELISDREQLTIDLERALKNNNKLSELKSMVEKKINLTEKPQPKPVIFTK